MLILGIDPGSRITGYGLIQVTGTKTTHVTSGCLRITADSISAKLLQIYQGIKEIVQQYQPQEAAIEQIFMNKNANSALKLGQARGAAIVACDMPVAEYSARQVKQSVVGYGAASKEQVQQMILRLLNLQNALEADAADALAIALCHVHSRLSPLGFRIKNKKRHSWRDFCPSFNEKT